MEETENVKWCVSNVPQYICAYNNFHEIPFIGYLVMAKNTSTDGQMLGKMDNPKPMSLCLWLWIIKSKGTAQEVMSFQDKVYGQHKSNHGCTTDED